MKIILVPDEGEWVLVPKMLTREMLNASGVCTDYEDGQDWLDCLSIQTWEAMLAAAPPCKVVELPAAPAHLEHNEVKAWYACLDDIERRAKTLA